MRKKVLVTGGLGYIGSHTVIELSNNGFDIVILDNLSNSEKYMIDQIKDLSNDMSKINFYIGDIRDKNLLQNVFSENDIYGVIHFAALKAVGESVANPLKYYDNNISGTVCLLEYMKKFNVENIIFSSSATVYNFDNKMPLVEEGKIGAINPYGNTKVIGESILNDMCVSDDKFNVIKLRYFNPLGAHKSYKIGESPRSVPKNLVPYISKVATGELKELSIFGNDYNTPDGTCIRDYVHVLDLASAHVLAIKYLENSDDQVNEVFNLGTNKGYSVFEILNTFEKVNNVTIPYKIIGRRPGDLDASYASFAKAKKMLNWEPTRGIEEMLEDNMKWESYYFKNIKDL